MKHEFAIYCDFLPLYSNSEIILTDKDICHRITSILRMQVNDNIMLFNRTQSVSAQIINISKKNISLKVLKTNQNINLRPNITILLSVLKKESYEEALYYCVELGTNVIKPVITQKVHFKQFQEKDKNRFERILVSAAEQSKNFNIPILHEPQDIKSILKDVSNNSVKIFFDAQGEPLNKVLNQIKEEDIYLFIGPEGDLIDAEKQLLHEKGFIFCRLTPTILRAQTAVALALGTVRTLLN